MTGYVPVGAGQEIAAEPGPLVISVKQPWAESIFACGKDVENRSWSTEYRGRLLIHVSQRDEPGPWDELLSPADLRDVTGALPPDRQHGLIIGHVRLIDVTRLRTGSPWAVEGQLHWLIGDPVRLPRPVHCRGLPGLWRPPAAVLDQMI